MEKAATAEQEGRAIAFLLSLSGFFSSSSPCLGSVTFPYTSSVSPKQCVGVFALNCKNHIPHSALLLTAPAAYQSWRGHLQEPIEVLVWVQESSLRTHGCQCHRVFPMVSSICHAAGDSVLCERASRRARHWVAQATQVLWGKATRSSQHLEEIPRPSGTAVIQTGSRDLQIVIQHSLKQLIS